MLGAGGTIAKRAANGDKVVVCIVTRGVEPLYRDEWITEIQAQCRKADAFMGTEETIFLDFPAVMLETVPRYELNGRIDDVIRQIRPDEVYIPHRGDMQMDHKMITDACMVALRPKAGQVVRRVYAYETLSETGWDIPNETNAFIPTVYEDITDFIGTKLEAMKQFPSQLGEFPNARSLLAIESLARFRGATVGCRAAEAFVLVRELK